MFSSNIFLINGAFFERIVYISFNISSKNYKQIIII